MRTRDVTDVDCTHAALGQGTTVAPPPEIDGRSRPVADKAEGAPAGPQAPGAIDRVLEQLDMEAAIGCGWWDTDTAGLVMRVASAGPAVAVLTAIAQLLRGGEDPDVIVGDTSARAAFAVAQEWLDADITPDQVAWWLRAGCWRPTTARALTNVGLRPWRLLDEDGQPRHWVEVPTPEGQQLPLARAVAEQFLTVDAAARVVTRGAT